jgi:thiamine phosphate synthase YjbQ (UPF0047 family)
MPKYRRLMPASKKNNIKVGQLDFGTWEQIFYGEFDGRKNEYL